MSAEKTTTPRPNQGETPKNTPTPVEEGNYNNSTPTRETGEGTRPTTPKPKPKG